MLKRILVGFACIFMVFQAQAVDSANVDKTKPYEMMKLVAKDTFARLKKEQAEIHKDPEHLKVVVEQELMPYVNSQYAALKLLGSNLRGAKRADVMEFVKAFHEYLVTSYAQVLTQYSDQKIEFAPAPDVGDRRIISIKVAILDAPRPNINLEFKLRKDTHTGEWQAFDMIADGISLLSSKKSEWDGKLRQQGILAVAKELEQLAATPIRFEGKDK